MQTDKIFHRSASATRGGKVALSVLVGIALLAAVAGGALYFVLQKSPERIVKIDGHTPQPVETEPSEEPDVQTQVEEPAIVEAAPKVDPAEAARIARLEKITSGSWTTRRMVALTAAGPYLIDFNVGIDGKSLEELELRNLDAIADQLLSNSAKSSDASMATADAMTVAESVAGVEMASERATEGANTTAGDMESGTDLRQNMTAHSGGDGELSSVEGDAPENQKLEIAWADLLDKPLVASGWLGNLIAEDEQRDQLISMYDRERDDLVTRDELRDFLSRGLSRRSSVQVADIGTSPDARDASPWGPFDLNEDYVLDIDEASNVPKRFADLDADDDQSLTLAEARPTSMQSMAMMQSSMVLAAKTLHVIEPFDDDSTKSERLRQFGNLAARVIEHYTFLSELPAEKWPGYPADRWRELDKDGSNGIDRYELRSLFELPADICIYLRFDSEFESGFVVHANQVAGAAEESASSDDQVAKEESDQNAEQEQMVARVPREVAWVETPNGGRLSVDGLSLQIRVEDLFSPNSRDLILGQIESVLGNAQVESALKTQFQLGDGALELADSDGNGKLDESERGQLWQWITARQSTRMAARWMLAPEPWFQLMDENADGVVAKSEASQFSSQFEQTFGPEAGLGDGDPLIANFTIRRADPRLENVPSPQPESPGSAPAMPADWFAAMDLNGDGAIEENEFVGDIPDFSLLDVNKDGYLRRSELYSP